MDNFENLQRQWSNLGERLSRLEEALAKILPNLSVTSDNDTSENGLTLVAPVKVLDRQGNILLQIDDKRERRLALYGEDGTELAELGASKCGGHLAIRNPAGVLVGYLTVENAGAKLIISGNNDKGGLVLFTDDIEGGGMNILDKFGNYNVTICSGTEGGEIDIYDAATETAVVQLRVPESNISTSTMENK